MTADTRFMTKKKSSSEKISYLDILGSVLILINGTESVPLEVFCFFQFFLTNWLIIG